jgi:hypothetical protein
MSLCDWCKFKQQEHIFETIDVCTKKIKYGDYLIIDKKKPIYECKLFQYDKGTK